MLSFTSSFRAAARTGIRVAAVFVLLFAGYALLTTLRPIYTLYLIDSWTQNRVLAERYMYDPQASPRVLVGSSMSLRMSQHELGDQVYNLSFAGIGPLTGLEILRRLGVHPKEVIIETNLIWPVNKELIDQLFDPMFFEARTWLMPLRAEYRPVNYLLSWDHKRPEIPALDAPIAVEQVDPANRGRNIVNLTPSYDRRLTDEERRSITETLPQLVKYLLDGGTRVTFLYLPMDPSFEAMLLPRTTAELVRQAFRPEVYRWLDVSPAGPFETRDGVHLVNDAAIRVARFLRQER